MPAEASERFLIAVSQLLGEQPPLPDQPAKFLICEPWALKEILQEIMPNSAEFRLTRELFNRLMLGCRRPLATAHFFHYFFKDVQTIDEFEDRVKRYRIKAMWLYGNFHFAFKRFATSKKADFDNLLSKTLPIPLTRYTEREPFDDIEEISVPDLDLLGYLTGTNLAVAYQNITALAATKDIREELTRIGEENQKRTLKVLHRYIPKAPTSLLGCTQEQFKILAEQLKWAKDDLEKRQVAARIIGKRNTHRYLSLPELDVYVATSMRETDDFVSQHNFIDAVFSDPEVKDLKLRFFDPTLSFTDDRISKGLVEMLMLRRAKVTIYSAGKEDTLGKDSELASTLAQGKAVIAYVLADDERRFKTFRDNHPLGLQIDVTTGVAHGIIVVRSPAECAKMLRKVMLRTREFDIRHENNNYQLVELETGSVVRVASDDPYLTHAFWTYFKHHEYDGY
jgi:hypothetical protein